MSRERERERETYVEIDRDRRYPPFIGRGRVFWNLSVAYREKPCMKSNELRPVILIV